MPELSRHNQLIKHFVETDETHRWFSPRWRQVPTNFGLRGFIGVLQRDDEAIPITFIPDAWDIDFVSHKVAILEVVDKNRISTSKLVQIYHLFWILDAEYYELEMVVHEVTMGITIVVPFQQMSLWALQGGRGEPWKATDDLEPTKPPAQ